MISRLVSLSVFSNFYNEYHGLHIFKRFFDKVKNYLPCLYCTLSKLRRKHTCIFGQQEDQWILGSLARSLSCVLFFCDPMHARPPGSSPQEISQAGILEWFPVSSSRGSSQPRYWTRVSCIGRWMDSFITEPLGKPYQWILDTTWYYFILPQIQRIYHQLCRTSFCKGIHPTIHAGLVGCSS